MLYQLKVSAIFQQAPIQPSSPSSLLPFLAKGWYTDLITELKLSNLVTLEADPSSRIQTSLQHLIFPQANLLWGSSLLKTNHPSTKHPSKDILSSCQNRKIQSSPDGDRLWHPRQRLETWMPSSGRAVRFKTSSGAKNSVGNHPSLPLPIELAKESS